MKIFSKILVFIFVISAFLSHASAANQSPKITESKIQIKGDTLVIMDANCESGKGNSLLSKLKKDSKTSSVNDCEEQVQSSKNPTQK